MPGPSVSTVFFRPAGPFTASHDGGRSAGVGLTWRSWTCAALPGQSLGASASATRAGCFLCALGDEACLTTSCHHSRTLSNSRMMS